MQLSAAAVLGAVVNDAAASGSPRGEPSYAVPFTTIGVLRDAEGVRRELSRILPLALNQLPSHRRS